MAYAYSPGLKVLESTTLHRERRLPLAGEVRANIGDKVSAEQVVMHTHLPGRADIVNVVSMLGCLPNEIEKYMIKSAGDSVEKGDLIAENSSFFGLLKTRIEAPITGTLEAVSQVTGQVTMRGTPVPVEVKAYIDGTVSKVEENQSVTVKTTGTFVQGIFGVGGETCGELVFAVSNPKEKLSPDIITENFKDKIIVGGSLVNIDSIKKAVEVGVKAIVVGGFNDADLNELLGYDLGVAITGHEKIGLTLIITEGFGEIPMAENTFQILKKCIGKKTSVNGATQIRAGVMRPEIIVPSSSCKKAVDESETKLILNVGTQIRVIREPYFGKLGIVTELPAELTELATESKARVLKVKFDDRTEVVVPRANVEVIATS